MRRAPSLNTIATLSAVAAVAGLAGLSSGFRAGHAAGRAEGIDAALSTTEFTRSGRACIVVRSAGSDQEQCQWPLTVRISTSRR
jgi:hypothetical protein